MSKQARGRPESNPDGEPGEASGHSFAWEYRSDEPAGYRHTPKPHSASETKSRKAVNEGRNDRPGSNGDPRQMRAMASQNANASKRTKPTSLSNMGSFGPARANYIRDQLDRALDRWWAFGELPPMMLLRDGLLLLETGGTVSESQRTLLLRAALVYGRGIQTALRHQADAERVALVLAEALVEWDTPLEAESLPGMLGDDQQVKNLLVAELERSRVLLTGEARRRAQAALEQLPRVTTNASRPKPTVTAFAISPARRRPFRQLLLILLLVALVGFMLWQQRQTTPIGMIAMPAASYALLKGEGGRVAEGMQVEAYFIDRFEVTNREYRTCVEHGACSWPVQPHSATRLDYFTNPAFDGHPVVNVTQRMAAAFCAWQDKRLPTAAEWQAAASVSPTTGQAFRYPWGASFDPQRANNIDSELGDTVVVGAFRPGGDSPSGVADMAGNVAEWTSTLIPGSDEDAHAIVKGGSFASDAAALFVGAEMYVAVGQATPEIGFRCARAHLLTQS